MQQQSLTEAKKAYNVAVQKARLEYEESIIDTIKQAMPSVLINDETCATIRQVFLELYGNDEVLDSILTPDTLKRLISDSLRTETSSDRRIKELTLSSPAVEFKNMKFKAVRYESEGGKILARAEGTELAKLLNKLSAEITEKLLITFKDYGDFLIGEGKTASIDIIDKDDFSRIKTEFEAEANRNKKGKQRYLPVLTDKTNDLLVCSRSGALSNEDRVEIAKLVLDEYIDLSRVIFELA